MPAQPEVPAAPTPEGTGRPAGVTLRLLRWWDVEDLLPLEVELFGAEAWSRETFWGELAARPTRWYVVAEADGGLAGYAGLSVSGPDADVMTVAVAPTAQGRGVGGVLLRALLGEAATRGASQVLLEVHADNAAAIRLYQRHGFERIAVRRGYYQPSGADAWIMRLRPVPSPATSPSIPLNP